MILTTSFRIGSMSSVVEIGPGCVEVEANATGALNTEGSFGLPDELCK